MLGFIKKYPHNQYMWIEITDINNRKTYIAICYFAPINSNFLGNVLKHGKDALIVSSLVG